ncbi:DUF835 domain-containing protein [Thermococcus stetteri]|uniref:DUF835 domain-containing protein n=1 Tax=Thermococcus stetteri TaxID=49900 RepID=UPI001AE24B83|nr:DUF835 domain-containing protein [Thermococcus stetteri]MBP1911214.1 hypothetical protein [Thermococcus stetteri]
MQGAIVHLTLAVVALLSLFIITLLSLYYWRPFVSHYPRFSRAYTLITLGFGLVLLSKILFLPLDLSDAGVLSFEESKESLLGTIANFVLFLGLFPVLFGWADVILGITKRYKLIPVVEVPGKPEEVEPGVYLVPSPLGLEVLQKLLRGRTAVILSRSKPDELRGSLGVERVPIFWLTPVECPDHCIHPRRLEYILQSLVNFMKREAIPKLVYLDGIEYLVVENGFLPVLKFLSTLKDYAVLNNTVVLIPVEESTFGAREWSLLEREFKLLGEEVAG